MGLRSPMTFSDSFKNGLEEAQKNLKPATLIWSVGLALAVCAGMIPQVLEALKGVVDFRKETDPWFTIITFATAGAFLPYLIELFTKDASERDTWRGLAAKAVLWAANGIVTKYFFKLLNSWFGEEPSPVSVAGKVAVDQFVYALLITTPIITLVYLWAGKDLSFKDTKKALKKKAFRWRFLETYMANLSVWLIAAIIMFSAPAGSSLIFALILMTFWGMTLSALSRS